MRILVCGGRDYDNWIKMGNVLSQLFNDGDTLIHGMSTGADILSEYTVRRYGFDVSVERYPADWKKYGKSAGYVRNKQMLDEGRPDLVVAFPGGKGTESMVKLAQEANVRVMSVVDSPAIAQK